MNAFRPMGRWRHALLTAILGLLLAALGAPAAAQMSPNAPSSDASPHTVEAAADGAVTLVPDPARLAFSGAVGDALGRTFTLKAVDGAASNVRISAGDLLGDPGQQALLASKITVAPAEVAAIEGLQTVTVTVATDGLRGGVYRGALSIWYDELPDSTKPLTVAVEVTVSGAPSVSVDANSSNQTLFAETRDAPFIGGAPTSDPRPLRLPFSDLVISVERPICIPFFDVEIDPRAPVLGQLPIALVAGNNELARVTGAEVLPVRNSASQLTLPSGIVSVDPEPSTSQPVEIPGQGAATLDLVLRGRNLPAGAYTGNLRVWVENQSQAITVPFTMKLKDHWVYAIAVLLASFVVGAAIAWFNGKGAAARANISKIRKLQRQLEPERNALENHLQKAEISTASTLLYNAMNAVRDEEGQNTVDARLKEFEDYVKGEAEKIAQILTELKCLKDEIANRSKTPDEQAEPEEKCQALLTDDEGLKDKIANSSKTPDELAELEKKCQALLTDVERGALDSRDAADAKVKEIKASFESDSKAMVNAQAPKTPQKAFALYELKVRIGTALVMLLAYLFALLVGWATLYLNNQTFGAPEDYLTLFLWGATVNVVAGQQIKLENIVGHKTRLSTAGAEEGQSSGANPGNGS